MTGVLLIGCGSIGRRRARIIASMGLPVPFFLYDLNQHAMRRAVKELREADLPGSAAVMECESLAGFRAMQWSHVLVCTPPTVRSSVLRELTLGAASRVFIEKPLAVSEEELDAIRDAVGRAYVQVAANLRWHPQVRGVVERIRLGARSPIGANFWMFQRYAKAYHDRGCGVLLDSIHELDLAKQFFGPLDDIAGFTRWWYDGPGDGRRAAYVSRHGHQLVTVQLCLDAEHATRGFQVWYHHQPPLTVELDPKMFEQSYLDETLDFFAPPRERLIPPNTLDNATDSVLWTLKLLPSDPS